MESKKYVVVDLDGTIAKVGDRLKYIQHKPKDYRSFYMSCGEDEPIKDVIQLVQILSFQGCEIVFCTGRKEYCRERTWEWIHKNVDYVNLKEKNLLMRHNDDNRHDTEVKPELLREFGLTPENTFLILEDRNSVCKRWRQLGFTCLQVAEGDF